MIDFLGNSTSSFSRDFKLLEIPQELNLVGLI